jgi:acyl dehydratase
MSPRVINGVDELKSLVGEHLGYSDWMEITQERVNQFADATGDHQWIHVDVERAKEGPFGGPIAHGYLTLSLGPVLQTEVFRLEGFSMGVNYGANKIRFPAPVPVGSKLRLGVKLLSV